MTLALVGYIILGIILPSVAIAPNEEKCVQPGIHKVYKEVEAKCPCYVQYRASPISRDVWPPSLTLVSFVVMSKENHSNWVKTGRKLSLLEGYALKGVSKQNVKVSYNLIPERKELNQAGNFVLVIYTDSSRKDCNVRLQYVFQSEPVACPPRLSITSSARIVSGTSVTSTNDARNDVLLEGRHRRCSGSLIAPNWVLTAAHCHIKLGNAIVGSPNAPEKFSSSTSRYKILRVIQHPNFTRTQKTETPINDIALVQLSNPVPNSKPYTLNDNPNSPTPKSIARASGYGHLLQNYRSNSLNFVDLPILGLDACRDRFRAANLAPLANAINDEAHICLGRDDVCNGGICSGDSGGPLISLSEEGDLVQVGVASYGDQGCGTRNSPNVFARVASYASWIQQTTLGAVRFTTVPGSDNGSRDSVRTRSDAGGAGTGIGTGAEPANRNVNNNSSRSHLSPAAKSALVALAVAVVVIVAAACIAVPWRRRRARKLSMTAPIDASVEPPPPPPAWDPSEQTDGDSSLTGFVVVPTRAGRRESLGTSASGFTVVPAKHRWR